MQILLKLFHFDAIRNILHKIPLDVVNLLKRNLSITEMFYGYFYEENLFTQKKINKLNKIEELCKAKYFSSPWRFLFYRFYCT